jgi:hypothetical protein
MRECKLTEVPKRTPVIEGDEPQMSKVRKLASAKIRKISGGKDPVKLVEEFMTRRGYDPEECLQQRGADITTWSISISEEEELEITLEGLNSPLETTLYIGVNVISLPLLRTQDFLIAALTIADTLIGAKLSLVNYDLVLSTTVYVANMHVEDVDYLFELITRQENSIRDAIIEELCEE